MLTITTPSEQYGIRTGQELVFEFNQNVMFGSGVVELWDYYPLGLVESFLVDGATKLRIEGNRVFIKPSSWLRPGHDYFVIFSSGSMKSASGELYAPVKQQRFIFTTEFTDNRIEAQNVDEGSTALFTYTTSAHVPDGKIYYVIGASADDVQNGRKEGWVSFGESNSARIVVPVYADNKLEGPENLTLFIYNGSNYWSVVAEKTIIINDTSKPSPSFRFESEFSSVNEGRTALFNFLATNTLSGTEFEYSISGVSAADVDTNTLTGFVVVNGGVGIISVPLSSDNLLEGEEELTVTVNGLKASAKINDVSKGVPTFALSLEEERVNEGAAVNFKVIASNVSPGTSVSYVISGSQITKDDFVSGELVGSVTLGLDNSASIPLALVSDLRLEGQETLVLSLVGTNVSRSLVVVDSSVPVMPTYSLSSLASSVSEGREAVFLLNTTGLRSGEEIPYRISGVSELDLAGQRLAGTVKIDGDGAAKIAVATITDTVTEGEESIILTINGISHSIILKDSSSLLISRLLAGGEDVSVYEASGRLVFGAPDFREGNFIENFTLLRVNSKKLYTQKNVIDVLRYEDGSYGLLFTKGSGSRLQLFEQKFKSDGVVNGRAEKLSSIQILTKELKLQNDLNGDGVVGSSIGVVLDGDGDFYRNDLGLYSSLQGVIILSKASKEVGAAAGDSLYLMSKQSQIWNLPRKSDVKGMAITEGGNLEVLLSFGSFYAVQRFDLQSGLSSGKLIKLTGDEVEKREHFYGFDISGDGKISLVGLESPPTGWFS